MVECFSSINKDLGSVPAIFQINNKNERVSSLMGGKLLSMGDGFIPPPQRGLRCSGCVSPIAASLGACRGTGAGAARAAGQWH